MQGPYLLARTIDILERGRYRLVHDYDGSVKPLHSTKIWFSNDGNYIPPRDYEEGTFCDNLNIFKLFECCEK